MYASWGTSLKSKVAGLALDFVPGGALLKKGLKMVNKNFALASIPPATAMQFAIAEAQPGTVKARLDATWTRVKIGVRTKWQSWQHRKDKFNDLNNVYLRKVQAIADQTIDLSLAMRRTIDEWMRQTAPQSAQS